MRKLSYLNLAAAFGLSAMLLMSGCSSDDDATSIPPAATTVDYIDYNGETRTAPLSAAAAEYHTGAGYGETMFDSAEKKCQHCHNELYDTWKSSMHGQSWNDKIFQSKYQDFLRTHIKKIGENFDIEYTETVFQDAAKTCIKCHAPGAYYSNDFSVTLEKLQTGGVETADLALAQANEQTNSIVEIGKFDTNLPVSVVAVSKSDVLYKATYKIGHDSNQEGITCAFCHSVETPRMMRDGDTYTLANDMRNSLHKQIVRAAGETLLESNSTDMNNFFRIIGPELPTDYASTNKGADDSTSRTHDGRYTMTSVNLDGTDGKTHYTGGPFYGPFGVSGKSNENADDETNRTALINPNFTKDSNNHFGNNGKSLCLSCHQRSAGALEPKAPGNFMELCSTQVAVTTGDDTAENDSISSPKCQKCHMERIEGVLLHKWAEKDGRYTAAEFLASTGYELTPELDENDTTVPAGENPQRDGWYNSHAFLGASKTGHKTSVKAKIQSGFDANLTADSNGTLLTVTTTLANKTAHMFPGAHPMRRVLTRIIVKDENNATIAVANSTGMSAFGDTENSVQPIVGKTLHVTATAPVLVNDNGSENLEFPSKNPDLNGSAVETEKFSMAPYIIAGSDTTITSQTVTDGITEGNVSNAAVVTSGDLTNFTRIYGRETGKVFDTDGDTVKDTFIVRPGFDSNTVERDSRLSPNETEKYTLSYDVSGKTGVNVTYKVYYMQKGANGKFIVDPATGFLDQAASDAKKLLVTEVFSATESVN